MDGLLQQLEDFKQLLSAAKPPVEQCKQKLTELRVRASCGDSYWRGWP